MKNNNCLAKHPICTWIGMSILFALIIHTLFSLPASNSFFAAKWTAGEILAYASTVALGLLAFWQNKRFQEENDKAQARLESLTAQANTLSIINKVIEIESANLSDLRLALDAFSTACDPSEIANIVATSVLDTSRSMTELSLNTALMAHIKRLDDCLLCLGRELRIDISIVSNSEPTSDPLVKSMIEYYTIAKKVIASLSESPRKNILSEDNSLEKAKIAFLENREAFLIHKQHMLNNVIYGNLSLDEIKEMYHKEYTEKRSVDGGQVENAQP